VAGEKRSTVAGRGWGGRKPIRRGGERKERKREEREGNSFKGKKGENYHVFLGKRTGFLGREGQNFFLQGEGKGGLSWRGKGEGGD